jgi:hypothetical protein
MPDLPKYHLGEQRADAILRPMALTLREMETRAAHYRDRLLLTPEDQEAVVAALTALMTARAELEKLWQARTATPRH